MVANQDRSSRTRQAILSAARKQFLKLGYDATTIASLLSATQLSKGALYHHFASKDEILEAIFRETSKRAIEQAAKQVAEQPTYLAQLKVSAIAWLKEIQKPAVAKLLLEIGPQGLGSRRARAIEDEYSLEALAGLIEQAKLAGETDVTTPMADARVLNAMLAEAAFAYSGEAQRDAQIERVLDSFIEGLKAR